jgi:two-component system nitrate/nitrite response regulator NarL
MYNNMRELDRFGAPHIGGDSRASLVAGKDQVTILLIGGSRLLQDGVIQLLDDSRFAVKGCVTSLDQAARQLMEQPDTFDMLIVQLVDTGEARFFERLSQLKQVAGERPVVLLAWPVMELTFVAGSLETGVDGYLESNMSQEGLQQALDLLAGGKKLFPPRMPAITREGRFAHRAANTEGFNGFPHPLPMTNLSGREVEILRHLAGGRANKVIANELGITEATVKVHVKGVLRKIGAANRTQAAIWALHNGLQPIYTRRDETEA